MSRAPRESRATSLSRGALRDGACPAAAGALMMSISVASNTPGRCLSCGRRRLAGCVMKDTELEKLFRVPYLQHAALGRVVASRSCGRRPAVSVRRLRGKEHGTREAAESPRTGAVSWPLGASGPCRCPARRAARPEPRHPQVTVRRFKLRGGPRAASRAAPACGSCGQSQWEAGQGSWVRTLTVAAPACGSCAHR